MRDTVGGASPGTAPLAFELPYRPDSAELFEALVDRPWPVFLDSGRPHCRQGQFDILACEPAVRLVTRGRDTEIAIGAETSTSREDPLALVRELLGARRAGLPGLPFTGGAIGYFGYDLARCIGLLPSHARTRAAPPEMAIGLYDWAIVVDHVSRRSHLVGDGLPQLRAVLGRLERGVAEPRVRRRPFQALAPVASNLPYPAYLAAIARIQHYLREGDCYQVNLAQRFRVPVAGDPWATYRVLRARSPAPYGAFLDIGDCQILCASPERFLEVRDGAVTTRPIKGTRRRDADPTLDRQLAAALRASPKDRAENLMIVDLVRNDLGRVCAIGSIRVPELFALESYAQVHHLVSTVCGRLAEGATALDLLRACFPGGSITGAPKRRAIEIIDELEPHRRGVYCGAIGYLGFDGAMDTNIAIRTLVHSSGAARLWAGGGIVADSDPELEYRETFDKASALLGLLRAPRGGYAATGGRT